MLLATFSYWRTRRRRKLLTIMAINIELTNGAKQKTALLELARQQLLCSHCVVLTEAATIAFQGGFPRRNEDFSRRATQKVIFHIQRELEEVARNLDSVALVLCDRGTPDNLAYWPENDIKSWNTAMQTTLELELERYHAVIHLEPAHEGLGYVRSTIRTESALDSQEIDRTIEKNWADHPRYHKVRSKYDFISKAQQGLKIIKEFVPECCSDSRL
jgi:hypothetical protein